MEDSESGKQIASIVWSNYPGFYDDSSTLVKQAMGSLIEPSDHPGSGEQLDAVLWGEIMMHIWDGNDVQPLAIPVVEVLFALFQGTTNIYFATSILSVFVELTSTYFRSEYYHIAKVVNWGAPAKESVTEPEVLLNKYLADKMEVIASKVGIDPELDQIIFYLLSFFGWSRVSCTPDPHQESCSVQFLSRAISHHLGNGAETKEGVIKFDGCRTSEHGETDWVIGNLLLGNTSEVSSPSETLYSILMSDTQSESLLWCNGFYQPLSAIALLKLHANTASEAEVLDRIVGVIATAKSKWMVTDDDDEASLFQWLCEDVMGFYLRKYVGTNIDYDQLSGIEKRLVNLFRDNLNAHTYSQLGVGLMPKGAVGNTPIGKRGALYDIYDATRLR